MHSVIKVGVFDSGVGGRFIADKLKALENVEIVYLSDPEYFPYGDKTETIIQKRLLYFTKQFELKGCRILVIACNSATTNGITVLREKFPLMSFIGVEPPVRPVAKLTRSGLAAVLGTKVTISSRRLNKLVNDYAGFAKIIRLACFGLAESIELFQSFTSLKKMKEAKKYENKSMKIATDKIDSLVTQGVDAVGIACTHYSYILPQLRLLYPKIKFYDPADSVVAQVEKAIIAS